MTKIKVQRNLYSVHFERCFICLNLQSCVQHLYDLTFSISELSIQFFIGHPKFHKCCECSLNYILFSLVHKYKLIFLSKDSQLLGLGLGLGAVGASLF